MDFSTIKNYLEVFASIGIIASGLGWLVSLFLKGFGSRNKENIETQNELTTYMGNQIEGYKNLIKDYEEKQKIRDKEYDNKLAELSKELASLQAAALEKDKIIAQYRDLLQNRNPELEQFMKDSREKWQNQIDVISQILKFMTSINSHFELTGVKVQTQTTTAISKP